MAAASVFTDHLLAFLVFLICLFGARAATDTGPSTAELIARIEALEKHGVEQRHRIERQEEHISELQSAMQRKNKHDANQDHRIATLQTRLRDQEKTIVTLLNHIKASSAPVTGRVQEENGDDAEERSQFGQILHEKESHTDRRSRLVMDIGAVAFLARMDHTLPHLGLHQNVRYDTVVTNIGGGYHQSHGVFIAPVAGIYIFSTTVLSETKPHNLIAVEIEKNGGLLATAYAYGDASHDQGSVTVVTQVAVSDEVWVRVGFPTTEAEIYGGGYSSFMGCLIMPTET